MKENVTIYAIMPEYPVLISPPLVGLPASGGLARLWREGIKGRGWKKEIPKQ